MTMRALLLALLFAFGLAGGASAAATPPPPLTGRVVDAAHVLPPEKAREIEEALAVHEAKTGEQVVVATVPSLGGSDIETYANETFRAWGLGQKDRNDGVLFLVAPGEREMRIEVGYGLEGRLTDALASQIVRGIVTPRFRAGDLPGGIEAGTAAILKVLDGEVLPATARQDRSDWRDAVPFLIFFLVWLFIVANARRRGGRGPGIWWGGGGGGFGGRGGGFRGGGGSSGGGGASGRW